MHVTANDMPPALGSRELFKGLQVRAYLAHAAMAPLSDPVRAAIAACTQRFAEQGAAGFGAGLEVRERLRSRLASLIGAEPQDIGFVQNTGHALAAVATSVPFNAADTLVLFRGEYPSNVSVYQRVAQRVGARIVWLDSRDFVVDLESALAALERVLSAGVRLVAVSAVQFASGLRMPLEKMGQLCRRFGALLAVDGVQALGSMPLDVRRCQIDFLACGGHKWLMGTAGLGFLYVRPEVMPQLQPLLVGNMSHVGALEMLQGEPDQLRYDRPLLALPQVFEGGMLADHATAALDASVAMLLQLGVEAISEHIAGYLDVLEQALQDRGLESLRPKLPELRSGILAMRPPGGQHAGRWAAALGELGVAVSSPDGTLRFAPHWPNHQSEITQVTAAVERVMADPNVS